MIVEASQSLLLAANRLIDLSASPVLGVSIEAVIVIAAIVIGYALGFLIAKNLRAPEYGWKLGLVLAAFLGALPMVLFGNYKLGVDLQGGVILVYEVDKVETAALDPQGRSDNWDMPALIKVLGKRLNPDGLKEIVIRPFGTEQIEIVVPEVDSNEVELIKQRITTGGALRFMVVADPSIDQQLVEIAREQSQRPGLELEKSVKNGEELIGFWARAARETDGGPESAETAQFRDPSLFYSVIRDARTGQIIDLPPNVIGQLAQNPGFFAPYLQSLGHKQIDVLLTFNQDYDIRGEDLGVPAEGRDSQLRPCILFSMKGEGRAKMGALTSANLQRKLAIVFDNELLSAPTIQERISDNGQITGQFSEAEVRFMVEILKSGSMPVVLYKNPISENRIGSILGMDTIIKGSRAIIVSLLLVLGFVLVYYRVSGIVACFALVLNILLTVAAMILLQAPFTLPGLAGLVLTVGMSVDANVLIYERIREELARGAALRMAIRNGFERAFTTILDSNLTTLLTAVVLYVIGTDQIRGFGISLIFGILTSMFTAVFCSRVILELGERAFRWKTLEMTKFMTNPTIDWVKYFAPATTVSVVLILIGLVATIARGPGLFDIDLAGGTSVTFTLKDPIQDAEVRTMLDSVFKGAVNESTKSKVDYLINEVQVEGSPAGSNYKVDSSLEEVDDLKKLVEEAFTKDGKLLLTTFAMSADAPVEVKEATPPPVDTRTPETTPPATEKPGEVPAEVPAEKPAETPAAEKPAEAPKAEEPPAEAPKAEDKPAEEAPKTEEKPADEKPAEEKPAEEAKPAESTEPAAEGSCQEPAADDKPADEAKPEEKPAEEKPAETTPPAEAAPAEEKPADAPKTEDKPAEEKPAAEATPVPEAPAAVAAPEGPATTTETPATPAVVANEPEVKSSFKLTFDTSSISAQALRDRVLNAARSAINEDLSVKLENPDWDNLDQTAAFKEWTVTLPVSTDKAAKVIDAMKSELDGAPVWQTSSKIGGQVSSDTRWRAIAALAFSIAGMIAYIWYRFNNVTWGIAAAVALLHDSLIMLGAIAASLWLTSLLGFAGVEEFKISLPVVAAFLTLIGYSVNDTIVIFDRIREIRGKSPDITSKIVNDSVNQTLSRSLLTSGTTLMVVTILYFFGGPGVHAFAFALVIGVIAGSYSTIYIASPILLWLLGKEIAAPAAAPAEVVKK